MYQFYLRKGLLNVVLKSVFDLVVGHMFLANLAFGAFADWL
jgi:hypothetical protein